MSIVKFEGIKIPAPELGPFEQWVAEVNKSVSMMKLIRTVTEQKQEYASTLLTNAKQMIKSIDEQLDTTMRPYIDLKNSINDQQKVAKERAAEVKKPLEEAIKTLNDSIISYIRESKKEAERLKRERELELKNAKTDESGNALEPVHVFAIPDPPKVKGLSVVTKFEVTSPIDVPRGYCVPDLKAIEGAIKAGVRDIPGIRIYTEEKIIG